MAKLTKAEEKRHELALELVDLDRELDEEEKWFVLEHFQEVSTALNSTHGAFFTPAGLASDFSIEMPDWGIRVIDLGAGIGRLSFACRDLLRRQNGLPPREFVCVEHNPEYVRVGKKVMPEATWVCGDILDVPDMGLGRFDVAIGNPPFGSIKRSGNAPGYTGRKFEYHAIAVAAQVADYGLFIIPQMSAPFTYSGKCHFTPNTGDGEYQKFSQSTGVTLKMNCGIDTAHYNTDWHGVSPSAEIVKVDFTERSTTAAPDEDHQQPVKQALHNNATTALEVPPPAARPDSVEHTGYKSDALGRATHDSTRSTGQKLLRAVTDTIPAGHPQLALWADDNQHTIGSPTDPSNDSINAVFLNPTTPATSRKPASEPNPPQPGFIDHLTTDAATAGL
ncbi:hypothetical protein ACQP2U_42475 (plasmid) [Nocardia sp. CA-084685]|uniref:hypothetical protein n=1 Tax=Nocardia sp. CA-084685 TaxID=3239970 RepID=UPI003D971F30